MASKTDYKTAVLEYLKKNPGVDISRDILIEKTKISKSRLTEVLQSIRADGYTIITPPRSGKVRFESTDNLDLIPSVKDADVRKWIILFLLSRYEKLTFRELLLKLMYMRDDSFDQMKILIDSDSQQAAYDDNTLIQTIRRNTSYSEDEIDVAKDVISVTALRKDLNDLREQKLVTMNKTNHTEYQLSNAAPYIIPISGDSLYEFCQKYSEIVSSSDTLSPLQQAYEKIKHLINYEEGNLAYSRFGRINNITQEQIDNFDAFIVHPYKTNLLELTSNYGGETHIETFAVGLIFYSVETGNFYVLGKNITVGRIECRRMDWFKEVKDLQGTHNEYHAKKYYTIYEEMFSAHYEDNSYKVKVLFSDFGNVTKRFTDLQSTRANASIRRINNKPEDCIYDYVYEDTIRGLSDFARYLRGFGMSVLAMDPPELKDKMLFTYNRIIEKYGELSEKY